MVGVAGKSKGCANCRKKKTKCDEAKPVCRRCQRSSIQCSYERFPVFIVRNQSGLQKRKPFEEVKTQPQLQCILSPELEYVRLISWFRETWTSTQSSRGPVQTQTHFLSIVGTQGPTHPALRAALLAMSFNQWSGKESNIGLQQRGRGYYQQSLELTQNALSSKYHARSDDILAAACIMTLYELVDPQTSNSWLDHIVGAGNLLCLRGPDNFTTAESRAMLEHLRYLFMIRCLETGAPCVFGSYEWRTLPWNQSYKPLEQQVFDHGLRLTSLRGLCDTLSMQEQRRAHPNALLSACIELYEALQPLIAQISLDVTQSEAGGPAFASTLLLLITAVGIQLGSAMLAQNLLGSLDEATLAMHEPPVEVEPETVIRARELCDACQYLARKIVDLAGTRIKIQISALETFRLSWPLRLAQEQFTHADNEMQQCTKLLAILAQRPSRFEALKLPISRHASSPVYRCDPISLRA